MSKKDKFTNSGNYLRYKGYIGSIEYSEESAVFHGKVLGVKPFLAYEGDSVNTITEDFHNAIDEYIEFCEEKGIQPEKPFKGSFNVRIDSELHRKAALIASASGISLNALVENAIQQTVDERSVEYNKQSLLPSE